MPLAATVNEAFPVDAQTVWLATIGVPIVTASQEEETSTITVKGAPTQLPEVGVTIYIAVPVPEAKNKVPVMSVCGTACALPPVTPPV